MTRPFSSATAEQVISAVDAVIVNSHLTPVEFVAEFSDLPKDRAKSALELAQDIGFLCCTSTGYSINSPLCRFMITSNQMQKAAVLRLLLESYQPFVVFRERLVATALVDTVAQQTKVALNLDAHREDIKDTLISLGTYSQALVTEGGGRYRPENGPSDNTFHVLAQACKDAAAAEARIREQLGFEVASSVSYDEVIAPLVDGLTRANANDPRGAVVSSGNAVESYLDALAKSLGISLSNAPGINAKLEKFVPGNKLPKKLIAMGKYLGTVRNAADHGIDTDIGASWTIRTATGMEYVYVACSFLAATTSFVSGQSPQI